MKSEARMVDRTLPPQLVPCNVRAVLTDCQVSVFSALYEHTVSQERDCFILQHVTT
jgi:hypothetical protein